MEKPHKKLDAWRESIDLTLAVYHTTDNFPKEHLFNLSNQIRRAALSVASNIAEGAARQTKKEFANFLHIAQASLSELDTQLEVAKKLTLLNEDQYGNLDRKMNHIDKLISGLIKHLKFGKPQRTSPHPSPLTPHR
ncbi:MAG: four helix bundle protein [Nitrospira sp.]|nr:four helix bundle protein [Nitrospira sp.]MDH5624953.1 four helix bundle protein [Nitrospira sp.]